MIIALCSIASFGAGYGFRLCFVKCNQYRMLKRLNAYYREVK